jgi:hypothetical protein
MDSTFASIVLTGLVYWFHVEICILVYLVSRFKTLIMILKFIINVLYTSHFSLQI